MHLTKVSAVLLTVLATGATAIPAAAPNAAPAPVREEPAPGQEEFHKEALMKRGFGCPGDDAECNDHCRSLGGGRTGGYCGGFLHFVCTCVFG